MELRHYLDVLRRWAIPIIIVITLTVAVTSTAGLLIEPSYTARATVRVFQDVGVLDLRIRETYGEILMNTYSQILTGWPLLEQAAERLGGPFSVEQLRQKITVEVISQTELMKITVEDQDPAFAALLANTLATLLEEYGRGLYAGSGKSVLSILEVELANLENEIAGDRQQLATLLAGGTPSTDADALKSQLQLKEDAYDRLLSRYELARLDESLRANSIMIVEPATQPKAPSNALGLKEIGISLVLGLFGGVGLALVLENLDTRIRSTQQIEHLTHLPVLGAVPRGLLSVDSSGRADGTGQPIEEAYRLLSLNLGALTHDTPLNSILITSAMPKEGKSTVVANLAQTLAERGQTVFLVEGDLRRPTIAGRLALEDGGPGLGSLLAERPSLSRESLGAIIQPAKQPTLFVISGGPKIANPTALLGSPAVEELLDYLAAQGQITLLDAPPVLGAADVSVLAPRVGGVILVVRQAHSRREQVLAALKQLQASRARVLGFVFLQKSNRGWDYQ